MLIPGQCRCCWLLCLCGCAALWSAGQDDTLLYQLHPWKANIQLYILWTHCWCTNIQYVYLMSNLASCHRTTIQGKEATLSFIIIATKNWLTLMTEICGLYFPRRPPRRSVWATRSHDGCISPGDSNHSARHHPYQVVSNGKECSVWATVAERHTEPLWATQRDIDTELPGWAQHTKGQ